MALHSHIFEYHNLSDSVSQLQSSMASTMNPNKIYLFPIGTPWPVILVSQESWKQPVVLGVILLHLVTEW